MTPEVRALGLMLRFPIRNTNLEAEAMQAEIAAEIRAAVEEERRRWQEATGCNDTGAPILREVRRLISARPESTP